MADALGLRCRELVELVTEYLDDAMTDDDRLLFEAHLADCRDCSVYLDQMRRTIAALGELPPEQLPASAAGELLALFRSWLAG